MMGEETTGYDPLADGVDDDTTSQRPVIAMSDLPDLRTTFDPDVPGQRHIFSSYTASSSVWKPRMTLFSKRSA